VKKLHFACADEYFASVRDLTARLDAGGCHEGAKELRAGFACLNGLTDGWALLLESLDRVHAMCSDALSAVDLADLAALRADARRMVHRR
jgi:hypothetical protein